MEGGGGWQGEVGLNPGPGSKQGLNVAAISNTAFEIIQQLLSILFDN